MRLRGLLASILCLELAGLGADAELDGVNLLPFLRDERDGAPHAALYWHWMAQSAVREGPWKYLRAGSREYLFHLGRDRRERNDVLAEHPEIASRLEARLDRWAQQLRPPGIEKRELAENRARYFDHYLEGKRIPPPTGVGRETAD